MRVLGLFHALSPEAVQKMDSDLKEAKAACQRQHGLLIELRNDMTQLGAAKDQLTRQLGESIMEAAQKDQRLTESIQYGCELQRLVSDATYAKTKLTKQLEATAGLQEQLDQHVRREATLKGQITKLKKRLANV